MCGAPGRPIVPSRGLRGYYARMLIPIAATASAAALGAWAYGTYEPNSPLFGRAVGRGPTRERVAYLTFDDGPNPGATEPILETLAASDVPAAFFLVGEHVRRFPEVARRVAAAGHEVGNHTLRHQKLHFRGPGRNREELERTHELIVDTPGRVPRSFRAPHGYRNPFVGVATRRLGYTVFGWTFGVWDSDPRVSAEEIRARVRRKLRPGAIILLHDGDGYDPGGDRRRTAAALPGIIADARTAGYTFRSSRMHEPRDIRFARSGTWSCEVPGRAVAGMAARPGGRRPGAQVLHRLPVAGDLRGAAGRRSVAPRRRAGGEPRVARGQGVGLAPHSEARRAPQLARGPGGQPGGRGGERPVRRGGGRGRARAPDRAAGRGASRRRGVVGRVDPRGGGAGPRLVSRDGAERAAARALAAGSSERGGAGAHGGAVARVGTRLGVARRPAAGIAPVARRSAANHGSGWSLAVADGLCALQLGRAVGHVSPRATGQDRAGVAGSLVHRPHRGEPGWAAAAYAREHRRHSSS